MYHSELSLKGGAEVRIRLDITRRENSDSPPYVLNTFFEAEDHDTVASALNSINADSNRKDVNGKSFAEIGFECSCLQKKCGACAMVICGRPMLACDARLTEIHKHGIVTLSPLKKFPPVADLIVDRSPMFSALKKMKLWLTGTGEVGAGDTALAFEASKCLQCGCCLEVCPNFYTGSEFYGMSAAVPDARLISAASEGDKKALLAAYRKHVYNGCGKSLACKNVCPAGIDTELLLVNSNAAALWKRRFGRGRR